jgi:RNA polymerase sigma factor (sigma-70 family)
VSKIALARHEDAIMEPHAPPSRFTPIHHLLADERRRQAMDGDLLRAFTQQGDNDAFAELLRRHGPMVLHLALHLLRHRQDAEDVFQATFLTLARKVHSLRSESSVAAWLHRVAWRLAVRCRKRRAASVSRLIRLNQLADAGRSPDQEISLREAQALLHQELAALPERLRLPLVLCYLQSRTRDEAARQLGWSLATLKRRLEQGRKLLYARLSRRGLTLSAALCASLLNATEVPASLTRATLSLATSAAASSASLPAPVAVLLAEMSWPAKAKTLWGLVLLLGACAGASTWVYHEQDGELATPVAKARTLSHPAPNKFEKNDSMSVTGQVLDPEGKPLAGTHVTVLAGILRFERYGGWASEQKVLGQGETDREGRFRLTVPRTSSLRNWGVNVAAIHAGYGLAWQSVDADANQPTAVVRLHPEQILHGRLIDLQGQPVAGAKLRIASVHKADAFLALDNLRHMEFVWPKPVVTDQKGNFLIRGLGDGATVTLCSEHEQCAPQRLELAAGATKTFVLPPARLLEGRVFYADTRKPVPHVEVGAWGVHGETDEQGRFRLNPAGGPIREGEESGIVMAFAPEGEPYLNVQKEFHWPKPAAPQAVVKHHIDLALPRGVLVRGRVTEKSSGKPVADASVFYQAQLDNPNAKREEAGVSNFAAGRNAVTSDQKGIFQIACLPSRGYLTIDGPTPDYVLGENGGYNQLDSGKRGGQPWLSHGFAAVDLQIGVKPPELDIVFQKGVTLKASVRGPEGRPIGDVQVFCRLRGFGASPIQVKGNRLELHGCDADKALRVMVFDAKNQWGATVEMSTKNAGEKPMSIQLAPCGSARVRFLDAEGQPLADFHPGLFLELAPKHDDLWAQTMVVSSPFRKSGPHTDRQGWCHLTTLIPGATYQFGHAEIETTFTAKAGETLKLPNVVMKTRP